MATVQDELLYRVLKEFDPVQARPSALLAERIGEPNKEAVKEIIRVISSQHLNVRDEHGYPIVEMALLEKVPGTQTRNAEYWLTPRGVEVLGVLRQRLDAKTSE